METQTYQIRKEKTQWGTTRRYYRDVIIGSGRREKWGICVCYLVGDKEDSLVPRDVSLDCRTLDTACRAIDSYIETDFVPELGEQVRYRVYEGNLCTDRYIAYREKQLAEYKAERERESIKYHEDELTRLRRMTPQQRASEMEHLMTKMNRIVLVNQEKGN